MTFLAPTTEPIDDLKTVAAALAGGFVGTLAPTGRGGNNRVYKVETDGGIYALKVYSNAGDDARDRLGTEWTALQFFRAQDIECVPQAIAVDRDAGATLHEWIEGGPVSTPGADDIDAAIAFAARLHELAQTEAVGEISQASEACLSGSELTTQIEGRIDRLYGLKDADLNTFLDTDLTPLYDEISPWSHREYGRTGWQFVDNIEPAARTLSPSDFGFHNAIRRTGGEIVFIDFEYFGWDDPVRLVSDFLLHPGMDLELAAKQRFVAGVMPIFEDDRDFQRRLELLYPLIGIRWCLIILNEFLPERWARRRLAGATGDPAGARARQLEKAQRRLAEICDTYRRFPFGG